MLKTSTDHILAALLPLLMLMLISFLRLLLDAILLLVSPMDIIDLLLFEPVLFPALVCVLVGLKDGEDITSVGLT